MRKNGYRLKHWIQINNSPTKKIIKEKVKKKVKKTKLTTQIFDNFSVAKQTPTFLHINFGNNAKIIEYTFGKCPTHKLVQDESIDVSFQSNCIELKNLKSNNINFKLNNDTCNLQINTTKKRVQPLNDNSSSPVTKKRKIA